MPDSEPLVGLPLVGLPLVGLPLVGLERVLASGDDGVATGEFGRIESMIATPPAGRGGARFGVLIPALKRACPLPDRTNDARATPERALGEKYL